MDDPFVSALFTTGKATIQATGSTAPMLLGVKDKRERLTLILHSKAEREEAFMLYLQALAIVLLAGVDTIYELRDVFYTRHKEGEAEPELPPIADPAASNGLMVIRVPIEGQEEAFLQHYGINDEGLPEFGDVEKESEDRTGPYPEAMSEAINRWKENPVLASDVELLEMKRRVGLMGRIVPVS